MEHLDEWKQATPRLALQVINPVEAENVGRTSSSNAPKVIRITLAMKSSLPGQNQNEQIRADPHKYTLGEVIIRKLDSKGSFAKNENIYSTAG